MTTCKIILTPTTKEPKICHALAITFAFNLKLCLMEICRGNNVVFRNHLELFNSLGFFGKKVHKKELAFFRLYIRTVKAGLRRT